MTRFANADSGNDVVNRIRCETFNRQLVEVMTMSTLVSDVVNEGQVSEVSRDNQVRRVGILSAGTALGAMLLFSVVSAAAGFNGFIFIPLALFVIVGTFSVPLAVQSLRQVNRDPEDSGVVWAVVGLVVGVSLIVVSVHLHGCGVVPLIIIILDNATLK